MHIRITSLDTGIHETLDDLCRSHLLTVNLGVCFHKKLEFDSNVFLQIDSAELAHSLTVFAPGWLI